MKDERRWDRGAWVTLAAGIGWLVLTVALSLVACQYPQDGWRYGSDDNRFGDYLAQANLTGRPSVLRAGDRVLAINGQPIIPEGKPPFPTDLAVGQVLRYTVNRNGHAVELDVPLVRLPATAFIRSGIGSLRTNPREPVVSLVAIVVTAFAFLARPGNLGARYLFLIFAYYFASAWTGFSVSSLYLYSFPLSAQYFYNIGGYSWYWAFFASLILMPLAFPVVKAPLRRFPHLLPAAIYGFGIVSTAILAYLQVATGDPVWTSLAFACFTLYVGLTVVSLFGTLIHNWITVREPVARAQLRWMTLGMGLGLGLPFAMMLVIVAQRGTIAGARADLLWVLILLPICLAIAITRYRLFDIDVIIRRTLVYMIVTALLAFVFYGSILLLQRFFTTATGQTSPIAIVASTLVIAGMFSPLRRRVQGIVDRRFYRRKYDAQQVLAHFATVARDETDVDRLSAQLTSAVAATLQPARIAVWMPREDAR